MKFSQVALYQKIIDLSFWILGLLVINVALLTFFAGKSTVDAIAETLWIYGITALGIFFAWLIAFLVTMVFAKAAELISLEQEYFGEEKMSWISKAFNFAGSIFLFYTAFTSFNLDIVWFGYVIPWMWQLVIAIAWVVALVLGIIVIITEQESKKMRKKTLSVLKVPFGLFALISSVLLCIPLASPSLAQSFNLWNTARIVITFALLLITIVWSIITKVDIAEILDELKAKEKDTTKHEFELSIILDKELLSTLSDRERVTMLHFAVSFAAFSFLVGMLAPMLINIKAAMPLDPANLIVFGLFLISGAFTWIEAIKLGSTMEPKTEQLKESTHATEDNPEGIIKKPIYINSTSIILSIFLDALLDRKGYLLFGMLGIFIFVTLTDILAPLWTTIIGEFTFPVTYLVGFAAIIAAYIVGFGLKSITRKIHTLLFTIGTIIVLVVPVYFILGLFVGSNTVLLNALYFVIVTTAIGIAYYLGWRSDPLPIFATMTKPTLKLVVPATIEALPVSLAKVTFRKLTDYIRIKRVATPKQMYDMFDKATFVPSSKEQPDFAVMDVLSYVLLKLKYGKNFGYVAIRTLGTSGNHLMLSSKQFLKRIEEVTGKKEEDLREYQKMFINHILGIEKYPDEEDTFYKIIEKILEYLESEKLYVGVAGVNPPNKNEYFHLRNYLIRKIINAKFSRKKALEKDIHLLDVLPSQLATVAKVLDMIVIPEPYATLLTNSREPTIRCQEIMSGITCSPSDAVKTYDCLDYWIMKLMHGTIDKEEAIDERMLRESCNIGFYGLNPTYLLLIKRDLLDELNDPNTKTRFNRIVKEFLEQPEGKAFAKDRRMLIARLLIWSVDAWLAAFRTKLPSYKSVSDYIKTLTSQVKTDKDMSIYYGKSVVFLEYLKNALLEIDSKIKTQFGYVDKDHNFKEKSLMYRSLLTETEQIINLMNRHAMLKPSIPEYYLQDADIFEILTTQVFWSKGIIDPNELSQPGVMLATFQDGKMQGFFATLYKLSKELVTSAPLKEPRNEGLPSSLIELLKRYIQLYEQKFAAVNSLIDFLNILESDDLQWISTSL